MNEFRNREILSPHHFGSTPESLQSIRQKLAGQLIPASQIVSKGGLPTSLIQLDRYLAWGGLPIGGLSLFYGLPGSGVTRTWLSSVRLLQQRGRSAAWITSSFHLSPSQLWQEEINLRKLFVVELEQKEPRLFFVLRELISSRLFDCLGCEWLSSLSSYYLKKIKELCAKYQVALVFFNFQNDHFRFPLVASSLFDLQIQVHTGALTIERASHRPSPYIIEQAPCRIELPLLLPQSPQQLSSGRDNKLIHKSVGRSVQGV